MIADDRKDGWIERLGRWLLRWGKRLWPYGALAAVLLAAVYAVLEGFADGVIGAAGAILGGVLAVWFQSRRTADLARRLRHEERRDEALLQLESLLARVVYPIAVFFTARQRDSTEDPHLHALAVEKAMVEAYALGGRS